MTTKRPKDRYYAIIEDIFSRKFSEKCERVEFERSELTSTAGRLAIALPKNLGDIIYSFKYRKRLPSRIRDTAPADKEWVIKNIGTSKYAFVTVGTSRVFPDPLLVTTKIPDSTPGIVATHALGDKQELLARVRHNRLIDIFSGVTCYSLQSHLRTNVLGVGQVKTDELYVGIDNNGRRYLFPVQAKGGNDEIGVVQIEQDILLCGYKYPELLCRPIAAQFMKDGIIAIFEFRLVDGEIRKVDEGHYKLVPKEEISEDEMRAYQEFPS